MGIYFLMNVRGKLILGIGRKNRGKTSLGFFSVGPMATKSDDH